MPPTPPNSSKKGAWNKVIGIMGIVFGTLALLQMITAPLMMGFTRRTMEASVTDEAKLEEYMAALTSLSVTSSIVLGLIAALLVIGGILLLKKSKIAPMLLMSWAVLKVAAGAFFNYKNYHLMQTQFELLSGDMGTSEMGAAEAEIFNNVTQISATIGLVGGMIWLMAFPIFILVWFNRRKVKQDIAGW